MEADALAGSSLTYLHAAYEVVKGQLGCRPCCHCKADIKRLSYGRSAKVLGCGCRLPGERTDKKGHAKSLTPLGA